MLRKLKKIVDRHEPGVSKQTGFPSAATHYMEQPIDLHRALMINTDATFYIRVTDESWKTFGIKKHDVLIIDRSVTARFNDLALVVQDGAFKVLRIPFDTHQESFMLWGVITYIIHRTR